MVLEGKTYGPVLLRVTHERVIDFVAVTLDAAERWTEFAPPGWAAAVLFAVAPSLLGDPELGELTRSVIHGEQRFGWEAPIPIGAELEVTGQIARVRQRGDRYFVNFEVAAKENGATLVRGSSTFLMAASGVAEEPEEEIEEPEVTFRGVNDPIDSDSGSGPFRRSASRADLVRYAAATGDWNPIHWDHASAVTAGLSGVAVHGLLQTAWLLSFAGRQRRNPAPIVEARCRYRSPLLAGRQGVITGSSAAGSDWLLVEEDREVARATVTLR